jgi:hypothetical protein
MHAVDAVDGDRHARHQRDEVIRAPARRRTINSGQLNKRGPPGQATTKRARRVVSHPRGHHMALRYVAVELRRGGQIHCGAGVAVSDVPGVADALGWVSALVARAAADRTHLDSTWSLQIVSSHPCVAPGPNAGAKTRRCDGHRARDPVMMLLPAAVGVVSAFIGYARLRLAPLRAR